jgi:hypothetical protein
MRLRESIPVAAALAGGVFFVVLGLWAFFDPQSFFDNIADFEPYNRHLIHDIGAFHTGLGAVLLLAIVWRADALMAALGGVSIGAVMHVVAHVRDRDLGGRDSDPFILGAVAAVLVLATLWRMIAGARPEGPEEEGAESGEPV